MPTNEKQVVDDIYAKIMKRHGSDAWFFKVVGSPYQMVGVPDVLVCVHGLLFGLEVKHVKPHETPMMARRRTEPVQRGQLRRLARSGAVATTIVSSREALLIIERGLRERGLG